MSPLPASKQEKLRALRAKFAADLPGLVDALENACRAADGGEPAAVQEAYRHAHTLAGSAGTFGFVRVMDEARALETLFRAAREAGGYPESEEAGRILGRVRSAVNKETAP